jgi:nucleotide-binding universal stress UspA family protein
VTTPDRPLVVVGVDGSTGSRDAVRWAAEYAKLAGAELRTVSSWRWPNYITRIPPGVDLEADTRRTLEEVVAEIRAEFPEVPVGEHVVEGPGGPALLSQAADASLLVVGARGRAAYPGMLLGSVAEYCVRNGPCPVVVVRTPAK